VNIVNRYLCYNGDYNVFVLLVPSMCELLPVFNIAIHNIQVTLHGELIDRSRRNGLHRLRTAVTGYKQQ